MNSLKDDAKRSPEGRSETLRVAIVGAGKMAAEHVRAIDELENLARVVGVVDPSEEARNGLLDRLADAQGAENLAGLLREVPVDVVHVCTPMEFHGTVAREALEMGCHVYVEKPVTLSLTELDSLLELVHSKNLSFCAGHQLLFDLPYQRLLGSLQGIGTPIHVESYFSFRPVRTSSGRGRPLTESEQLLDIVPHPTYLLLDLLERVQPSEELELLNLVCSPTNTVHGLVRRGALVASLVVSLESRPVEHWLRVHGTNGSIHADFVRGSFQELLGPGATGIDKALHPFRLAVQLMVRNAWALGRRLASRRRSYPGLSDMLQAFYASVKTGSPSPTSQDQLRGTVRISEELERHFRNWANDSAWTSSASETAPDVLVTGGTGLLGREVARLLVESGRGVRVLSRRLPPPHRRLHGVHYVAADLAEEIPEAVLQGIRAVVHCAAETSGGWDAHARNSILATERLVREAASRSVEVFVHVSSVGILDPRGKSPIRDDSPLHPHPRRLGPYVWGKLESERTAVRLGQELPLRVKVVRPIPLVDWGSFQAPGRLGRRLGNLFVAVGGVKEALPVASAAESARATVAAVLRPDDTSEVMNLVPQESPTRGELIARLRERHPEIWLIRVPRLLLYPLSWMAVIGQKVIRPRRPAVRLTDAFASIKYEAGPARSWMSENSSPIVSDSHVPG